MEAAGLFHNPEARKAPSAPTVPVILVPGLNSCILSVPPAMSAAVLPAVAVIPQASARLDWRVPTYRPSCNPDGSGLETWAQPDRDILAANGYEVEELRLAKGIAHARVSAAGGVTLVDWTQDTAWRFFPAIADREFGWRLHDLDLAVNKVLATAGRREPRDFHDLVALIRDGVPLSSLAWAGCAKDPGLTPSLILDECVHNSRYDPDELRAAVATSAPVDPAAMTMTFRMAVRRARDLFETLPLDQAGHLYLDADGHCIAPDPAGVAAGTVALHAATLNGAWPMPLDEPPAEDEPEEAPTP